MAQGLLLDIGAGTLTVYVNGARKGDMVQPDMLVPPPPGIRVRTPEPPLRWAVGLEHASVEIGGPLPPPLEAARTMMRLRAATRRKLLKSKKSNKPPNPNPKSR